ncbi:methyl-accepting chemotaxis protein [Paenibacillus sp. 1P07SE]|uniref:methyl-accepting chemotaxis protein n=1 Tax=Paenibacillus sp. 1P07SE TaxID=3132209 RepID=UPI0039A69E7C
MSTTRKGFRLTIRIKLMLAFLLLMIIPTAIVGMLSYNVSKAETDKLIRNNLQNTVKIANQNIITFHEAVMNGDMSLDQAQAQLKSMLLGFQLPDGSRPGNRSIDLGENGSFMIIDHNGQIVASMSSNEGQLLQEVANESLAAKVDDIISNALSGGDFTYYTSALESRVNSEVLAYGEATTFWNWIIIANTHLSDFNHGQENILRAILLSIAVSIVVGAAIAFLISSQLSSPIRRIAQQAKRIAEGHLTDPDIKVTSKDETGELAQDFNVMTQNLKLLITQVIGSSEQVAQSSGKLNSAVAELTQASKHTADAIQEIATGIEVQANGTEQSTQAMEEMTVGIRRIADSSAFAYDVSLKSEEEALQGNEYIERSISQMHLINESVREIAGVITESSAHSREISEAINLMTEIANQTNLLSLNASIEASRAGEYGRGFAVVAAEIKKLSGVSSESAKRIIERVDALQTGIASAVEAMRKGEKEVEEGLKLIGHTGELFKNIKDSAVKSVSSIQDTSAAAEQLSASSEEVFASLQEIEKIAGQSAAGAQSISASSEEQIASMEEVGYAARELERMSEELKRSAERFKV